MQRLNLVVNLLLREASLRLSPPAECFKLSQVRISESPKIGCVDLRVSAKSAEEIIDRR